MQYSDAYNPRSVLLIEDTYDDEFIALRAFRACGIALLVRVARDGEQALRMLGLDGKEGNTMDEVPDLVISDVKLPFFHGNELLCRARAEERLSNIPYIMFSSSCEMSDVRRCLDCGATAYAQKPVGFVEYITCIFEIVHWSLCAENSPPPPSCVTGIKLS